MPTATVLATQQRDVATLALGVLMPSFRGTTLPADYAALLAEGLGGICLFGTNTAAGPASVRALTDAIHAVRPGAVVAVDEEGGDVTRLHAAQGSPVLGPAALGAVDDLAMTRATGRAVGLDLAAAGIDLDLAPVADVNSNPDNPVIGTRSFSADAAPAAAHVTAWVEGLRAAGVAACAKHFPGHGDTGQDSHLELPTLDVPLAVMAERELVPFAAAVEAGVAAVMTGHIVVPALDPGLPGTLSAPVLGLLRERLGFRGVIVSDALDMAGASGGRGIPEAAVLSLVAGADLLCVGPAKPAALVREIQAAIVAAVADGRLARERLEAAAGRGETCQGAWRDVRGDSPRHVTISPVSRGNAALDPAQVAGARRALRIEGTLPDLQGAMVVTVPTTANVAVGEVPWGLEPDAIARVGEEPPPAVTAAQAEGRPLIVQVRDAHRRPEVGALLAALAPAVVVEWGWPGEYDGGRICPHGWSRPGAVAVTEALRAAGWGR